MFIMRRSLPPYPISTTCCVRVSANPDLFMCSPRTAGTPAPRRPAAYKALFHRRRWRGDQSHRAHLEEQRRRLAEEGLPLRVLQGLAAHGRAIVQIAVSPEVHDLVELGDLGLEHADVLRVLLAHGHDRLEMAEPLAGAPDLGAIRPELVDVPAVARRLERQLRREDLVLLGQEERPDLRDIIAAPRLVLGQLAAKPLALDQIGVGPEVDVLVEGSELARPRALELAVLVAADRAADLSVELEVLALLAGLQGVGPELVDHARSPGWMRRGAIIGTGPVGCRRHSPSGADSLPTRPRGGSGAGRDGRRR